MPATQDQSATQELKVKLPADLLAAVRAAVASGDYASDAEVLNDALQEWQLNRAENIEPLRAVWQEAIRDDRPGLDPDDVFDRLEKKYSVPVALAER